MVITSNIVLENQGRTPPIANLIQESIKMSSKFLIPSILFTLANFPLYIPWFLEDEVEGIPRALYMSFPFHEQNLNSCGLFGILPILPSYLSMIPSLLICGLAVFYFSMILIWRPKTRTLMISLMNLGITIYLFKRDSEYNDICLILLPALIAMVDIRPIFFVMMMLVEFSLLPDYNSVGFCLISVVHLALWKLYFISTFKFE